MSQRVQFVFLSVGFVCSLLLSALFYFYDPVINPDGLHYLAIAEGWPSHSLKELVHVSDTAKWPFYSMLIYFFDKHLHIHDLELAAWMINAVCSASTWVVMILLLRRLGASVRAQWIGGIIFLFFHEWLVVRQYIVRDHGYWLFYFLSIFSFCEFLQTNKRRWFFYILFLVSAICAALFRVEGLLTLGLLPFSILFLHSWPWSQRRRYFLYLYVPIIFGFMSTFIFMHVFSIHANAMGRLFEFFYRAQSWWEISKSYYQCALEFHYLEFFPFPDPRHFLFIWIAQLLTAYFIEIVKAMSVLYCLVLLIGYRSIRLHLQPVVNTVVLVAIGLNLILLFLVFTGELFVSNRYVMAMVLSALIFVPLILDRWISLYMQTRKTYYRIGIAIVMLLCVAQIGFALHSGIKRAKNHQLMFEAAALLKQAHIPLDELYVNDSRIIFYAYFYPHQYYAFAETILSHRVSYQLAENKKVVLLLYNRSGIARFPGWKSVLEKVSRWKIEYVRADRHGRRIVIYRKN